MGGSEDGEPNRIAATRLILSQMLGELAPYIVRPVTPKYENLISVT